MTPAPSPHRQIYINTAKPEDFENIEIFDWIEGVGEITTEFEKQFVRRFGASHTSHQSERDKATTGCRKIVGDKIIFGKCPFNSDCGRCFLCDNAGGCIVDDRSSSKKEKPITKKDVDNQRKICRIDGTWSQGDRDASFCNYKGKHPYWCVADDMLHPEECPRLRTIEQEE